MSDATIRLQTLDLGREILLTPICASDARELFRLTDRNRAHLRAWLPWLDQILAVGDTRLFIRRNRSFARMGLGFVYVIRWKGRIVGVIDMHHIDRMNRVASIGYWLSEDAQGRGIMSDACRAVVRVGFEQLRINRIEIRCATFNVRSRSIPEHLLFRLEGECRESEWLYDHFVDHAVYAMLASEWRVVKSHKQMQLSGELPSSLHTHPGHA